MSKEIPPERRRTSTKNQRKTTQLKMTLSEPETIRRYHVLKKEGRDPAGYFERWLNQEFEKFMAELQAQEAAGPNVN